MTPTLDDLKQDNLMLLIGTNPLPNYIAAKMLWKEGIKFHFVHTKETKDTSRRLAQALGQNINDPKLYIPVNSSNPDDVYTAVTERVSNTAGSWGLNYTGGKKSMATHAYRAMETALAAKKATGVFSYLDADRRALVVDAPLGRPPSEFSIDVQISLQQLLQLHGQPDTVLEKLNWVRYDEKNIPLEVERIPRRVPSHPEFCQAFLDAWLNQREEMEKWRAGKSGPSDRKILQEICAQPDKAKELACQIINLDPAAWLEQPFPAIITGFACPGDLAKHIKAATGIVGRWQAVGWQVEKNGPISDSEREKFSKWLDGFWLENYVLSQVIAIQGDCKINDMALGLHSLIFDARNEREDFESDVIFMQGHRLFYITVTTNQHPNINKTKLFEAYHRAQQLGGEHAEVCLVSLNPDPARVERELNSERHARVKAFGADHLKSPDLFQQELKNWITATRAVN